MPTYPERHPETAPAAADRSASEARSRAAVVKGDAGSTGNGVNHPTPQAWPEQGMLAFRVGTATFAVDILQVREIRHAEPALRIAGAPAAVLGVLHLRGQVVPLICLRQFGLGDGATGTSAARAQADDGALIVVDDGRGGRVAARVDAVLDVIDVQPAQFRVAPALPAIGDGVSPAQLLGLIDVMSATDAASTDETDVSPKGRAGLLQWLDLRQLLQAFLHIGAAVPTPSATNSPTPQPDCALA
jgi:chemotaxis signal transduction protein